MKWFKVREVEYSTDFNFFLEHQLLISNSQGITTYCSRLEQKAFLTENTTSDTEEQKLEKCRKIHFEIIRGKHGLGELIF